MKALWIPVLAALATSSPAPMDGQPDRVDVRWYESGRLESVRPFRGAKRVGWSRAYWPDGRLRIEAHYEDDAYDGDVRTWYADGRAAELRHYRHGREDGRQQAWTSTGVMYLNYDARNGRHYGLINSRPCLPIHAAKS